MTFDFRFRFCVSISSVFYLNRKNKGTALPVNNRNPETTEDALAGKINKMAAMENILEEVFVRRFLMEENNSDRDLLVVIKNRYPNLRVCSLRTVKKVCSYHGIKKRMSVADGTDDIAVQGAISEVRLCSKRPASY